MRGFEDEELLKYSSCRCLLHAICQRLRNEAEVVPVTSGTMKWRRGYLESRVPEGIESRSNISERLLTSQSKEERNKYNQAKNILFSRCCSSSLTLKVSPSKSWYQSGFFRHSLVSGSRSIP